MVSVRVGERALPLTWAVVAGAAKLGFAAQCVLLETVRGWLPDRATVFLAADRFYPSAPLLAWRQTHGWGYRLRLKGNHALDVGCAEVTCTGDFAGGSHKALQAVHACSSPGSRPLSASCMWLDVLSRGSSPWTAPRSSRPCVTMYCAGGSNRCSRTSRAVASVWKTPSCAPLIGLRGWC